MQSTSVLLVDDELPFIQAMIHYLTRRNIDLVTASTGAEALAVLEKQANVDVVILDVRMPGMDGITTLKKIKKDHPLVEVIILTGYFTMESAIRGMKLDAFDYMMKPCDVKKLLEKVKEAKANKNQREEKIARAALTEISP